MIKTIFSRVLIVITAVMTIIGIILMFQTMQASEDPDVITVYVKEGTIEIVEFADLTLIPGASCKYGIKIKSEITKSCNVQMHLVAKEQKGLEKFAYVKILSGDTVLYEELLETAFSTEGVSFPVDFVSGKNVELTVEYYLPESVGNEAKNAEAVFELQISASNE